MPVAEPGVGVETVDLATTPLRELNARLHGAGGAGIASRWRVVHPHGAHAVAVGIDAEIEVDVDGHVGYYCAGMNQLATVRVHGNAGVGLAENIMSGTVCVDGMQTAGLSAERLAELRRKHIGFIFQSYNLFPTLTALENVRIALDVRGMKGYPAAARAEEVLREVGLGQRLRNYPGNLSGGEQQRVAVARALANRPALVLADEPTGNLDEATADIVFAEFLSLVRGEGSAALVATHNERIAAKMDRVLRLHEGVIE